MSTRPSLITVVDDESSIRKALRRLILTWDMRAETFESGQAFLDSLVREHPDCVILDVHMPGLTGIDVQHEIVRRGLALPVIAITGTTSRASARSASRRGPSPISTSRLTKFRCARLSRERCNVALVSRSIHVVR